MLNQEFSFPPEYSWNIRKSNSLVFFPRVCLEFINFIVLFSVAQKANSLQKKNNKEKQSTAFVNFFFRFNLLYDKWKEIWSTYIYTRVLDLCWYTLYYANEQGKKKWFHSSISTTYFASKVYLHHSLSFLEFWY